MCRSVFYMEYGLLTSIDAQNGTRLFSSFTLGLSYGFDYGSQSLHGIYPLVYLFHARGSLSLFLPSIFISSLPNHVKGFHS
jgi:hypothetical protein